MDALATFNSLEAALWIAIGLTVWRRTRSVDRLRRLGQVSSVWFILFGTSDIFEVYTGAWYRPLSLLAYKAVCLMALIACGLHYRDRPR